MTEEQVETIAFSTEFVLKRRMLNANKGIGEITLDILVALDRIWLKLLIKGYRIGWMIVKYSRE